MESKPDLSGIIGEPAVMLRPPLTLGDEGTRWENLSVTTREVNRCWTEGPWAFRHGGR